MANVILQNNNSRLFAFLKEEKMTNVTLTAEGKMIKAHKLILASASKYFEELFETLDEKHPVIVLKDVTVRHLKLVLEYIYTGRVDLHPSDMSEFKSIAVSLGIKVDSKQLEPAVDFETLPEVMSEQEIFSQYSTTRDQTMICHDDLMDPSFEESLVLLPLPDESLVNNIEKANAGLSLKHEDSHYNYKSTCDMCWVGEMYRLARDANENRKVFRGKCTLCGKSFSRLMSEQNHQKRRRLLKQFQEKGEKL